MERVPVVRVRGRGVQITDEIRARVQDRVGRSTRYFSRVGDVDVNLVKLDHRPAGGQRFRAEIATRSARHDVRAEGLGDTVDRALDAAADRFAARLRRLGERLVDRRKQRSKGPKRAAAQGGPRLLETDPVVPDIDLPEIVRERWQGAKPMTPEDAALVMEERDGPVLLFIDAESGGFSVMYRRDDGRLGLVEAE